MSATGILVAVCAPGLPVQFTLLDANGRGVGTGHGADEGYSGCVVFTLGAKKYAEILAQINGGFLLTRLSGKDLTSGEKITADITFHGVMRAANVPPPLPGGGVWSPAP